MNFFVILALKAFSYFINLFNLGNGSTWPGHIALKINPNFCKDILLNSKTKKVVIVGTNGKTTTGKLLRSSLETNGKIVISNQAGANLLNGLASMLIQNSSVSAKLTADYLIFESDEFALSQVLEIVNPEYLICLDLFRDQLDRYGEIDSIAKKWKKSIEKLPKKTVLILNADDPLVSFLGKDEKRKVLYFGLNDKENLKNIKHGADSTYCPNCMQKLEFDKVYFSHLGVWKCNNCGLKRPKLFIDSYSFYPLTGIYNKYNTLASLCLLLNEKVDNRDIGKGFKNFVPAFGRQEEILYKNHQIVLFLSKNPTSFNESLSTIKDIGGTNLLFVLNDRIPDGLDVSWIWDIGIERIIDNNFKITVSGERCYDMALRLKYAGIFCHIEESLKGAIDKVTEAMEDDEKLYILPNYSAMLDTRKILTGRKLL